MSNDNDPIRVDREWHFADGTILPVVSGGADDQVQPDIQVQLNADGTNPSQTPDPDDLVNPFLKNVPEVDRHVVEPYYKKWQGEVTRRFQDIHKEYEPYRNLGDPEQLRTAQALYQRLNDDPSSIVRAILEVGDPDIMSVVEEFMGGGQQQQYQQGPEIQNPWADDGVPDSLAQTLNQLTEVVSALAEGQLSGNDRMEQEQEERELDETMTALHSQFGDFNEKPVLLRMYDGMDPEEAVQDWFAELQHEIDNRRQGPPPPPVLGGRNGSVPAGGPDPSKMNPEDRRKYVTDALTRLAQNQ